MFGWICIAAGFMLAGIVLNSVGHFTLSYSRCIWLKLSLLILVFVLVCYCCLLLVVCLICLGFGFVLLLVVCCDCYYFWCGFVATDLWFKWFCLVWITWYVGWVVYAW